MSTPVAWHGRAELVNLTESHLSGMRLTLWLPEEGMAVARHATTRRGGQAGTRYQIALTAVDTEPPLVFEGQMAGWTANADPGGQVTFWLNDPALREQFLGLPRRRRGNPGKAWWLTMVEIGEDEQPVNAAVLPPPDPAPAQARQRARQTNAALSQHAARLCRDPAFHRYLASRGIIPGTSPEQTARTYLCTTCGISSRAALDSDTIAAQRYHVLVRQPFLRWFGTN